MSLLTLSILTGLMAIPELSGAFLRESFPRRPSSAALEFFVDPEGVVLECQVLAPEVDEQRAREMCRRTIGENVGTPARGPDGEAAYGLTSGFVVRRSGSRPPSQGPDIEVLVAALPEQEERVSVFLLAFIDSSGAVQHCQYAADTDPALGQTACSQLGGYRFERQGGLDGEAVGYVRAIQVDFLVEPASG